VAFKRLRAQFAITPINTKTGIASKLPFGPADPPLKKGLPEAVFGRCFVVRGVKLDILIRM
jgi:hypothetical protein